MIYTVVCTDVNAYINWQCELLEYSWSRVNQPGKLIRLVACDDTTELPKHRHAEVIRTQPTNVHPTSGDVYVCYNRLYSLKEWLEDKSIQGTILIVDADVVFRSPLAQGVAKGRPLGQAWLDYGVSDEFRDAIEKSSDTEVDSLQPVTWPALIDADDLRKLLPRWIETTVAIREQIQRQESDMYGFLIAAKECDLEFELGTTTAFMPWPDEQVSGAPIIHYCQAVKNTVGDTLWSKFEYTPWDRVPNSETAEIAYCQDLVSLVDEFARVKQFEAQQPPQTIFIAIASYCEPEIIDTVQSCINKARNPQNLRFGICHQYDNSDSATSETCLDRYSQDARFKYVIYDYKESKGGCWARNIAQQLYDGETYTMQIDAHTQMLESWDTILIEMLSSMPSDKPLITQCPPLYWINDHKEKEYKEIDDLSRVNTAVASGWSADGWLEHTQVLKTDNSVWPRYTRMLSGGFVFTSGEWNNVVRQDPEHFYTGEEFALALRSYTHGYDLFDPNQIVCWHRLHPKENRKYWTDNSDANVKHEKAIARLNLLITGDPENSLGRYGLGCERTLTDFANFSGIDCINRTVSQAAIDGSIIDSGANHDVARQADVSYVDITLNLQNVSPIELSCDQYNPTLLILFEALHTKLDTPNDLVYLELDHDGKEKLYFKKSEIVSIETSMLLGDDFFDRLWSQMSQTKLEPEVLEQNSELPSYSNPTTIGEVSDDWKIWIWDNISNGRAKDVIFKEMIDKGFAWHVARGELNYEPTLPLDQIGSIAEEYSSQIAYQANSVAQKIENSKIEIYYIDDFLNEQECEDLIEIARANLEPSTVVGENGTDKRVQSEDRTSNSCFFNEENNEHNLAIDISK